MTLGHLVLLGIVLFSFIVCGILSRRTKRYREFGILYFVCGGMIALLCVWFAIDCFVVNPTATEGFFITPIIRFMLQDDWYTYPQGFWFAMVWFCFLLLLCVGFGLYFVRKSRQAQKA